MPPEETHTPTPPACSTPGFGSRSGLPCNSRQSQRGGKRRLQLKRARKAEEARLASTVPWACPAGADGHWACALWTVGRMPAAGGRTAGTPAGSKEHGGREDGVQVWARGAGELRPETEAAPETSSPGTSSLRCNQRPLSSRTIQKRNSPAFRPSDNTLRATSPRSLRRSTGQHDNADFYYYH